MNLLRRLFSLNYCKFHISRFISFHLSRRFQFANHQHLLRRKCLLFASLAAGFSFQNIGLLEEELSKYERDSTQKDPFALPDSDGGWEKIFDGEATSVFRRKMEGKDLYEYRVIGSYADVSALSFVNAQNDIEYRRKWDKNLKSLELLAEDPQSGAQLIRWESTLISMLTSPRLYVFVRRQFVDRDHKCVIVLCKALDEQQYPDSTNQSSVRVTDYASMLVVRAHTDLDKHGLDFVLTYHEDAKLNMPKKVYDFGVNFSGPGWLSQAHDAAVKYGESGAVQPIMTAEEVQEEKAAPEEEQSAAGEKQETEAAPEADEKKEEEPSEPEKAESAEVVSEDSAEPTEEAEEEEKIDLDELTDPLTRARAECAQHARVLKKILEECNRRVRSTPESVESCHMEMVDYVQALDHCASPKAFAQLK